MEGVYEVIQAGLGGSFDKKRSKTALLNEYLFILASFWKQQGQRYHMEDYL